VGRHVAEARRAVPPTNCDEACQRVEPNVSGKIRNACQGEVVGIRDRSSPPLTGLPAICQTRSGRCLSGCITTTLVNTLEAGATYILVVRWRMVTGVEQSLDRYIPLRGQGGGIRVGSEILSTQLSPYLCRAASLGAYVLAVSRIPAVWRRSESTSRSATRGLSTPVGVRRRQWPASLRLHSCLTLVLPTRPAQNLCLYTASFSSLVFPSLESSSLQLSRTTCQIHRGHQLRLWPG
jgi:hypothetical protein